MRLPDQYSPMECIRINQPRLRCIRERFFLLPESQKSINIGIQTEEGYQLFSIHEIAYLEKENRKVKIVGKNGSCVKSGESMQVFEEFFLEYGFFRCHQSYLIPLMDIQKISWSG